MTMHLSTTWQRACRTAIATVAAVAGFGALALAGANNAAAAPHAAPAARVCQWVYSSGGASNYIKLGRSSVPLADMNFGQPYGGHGDSISQQGYVDFDGDGRSDVFAAYPLGAGRYRWQYRSGGVGPWHVLGDHPQNAHQLLLGDFNGDGRTDVAVALKAGTRYQVKVYYSGQAPVHNLARIPVPLAQMRLGDFNGDGRTDIFAAVSAGDGSGDMTWEYFPSAKSAPRTLDTSDAALSALRFGDFDGDDRTDVFFPESLGQGQYRWNYLSSDEDTDTQMMTSSVPIATLRTGDFSGDGVSDIFTADPRSADTAQWEYSSDGQTALQNLAFGNAESQIRFASFDHDADTDIFAGAC